MAFYSILQKLVGYDFRTLSRSGKSILGSILWLLSPVVIKRNFL